MNIKFDIKWNFGVVYVIVCITSILIVNKIVSLQFFNKNKWNVEATKINKKRKIIPAKRGNIYDEEGNLLACSLPFYEFRMDMIPQNDLNKKFFHKNVRILADSLANLFKDKTSKEYKEILIRARKKKKRNFLIKKKVSHDKMKRIKTFPILNKGKFSGGLIMKKQEVREKPYGKLAFRTIGFKVKTDNGGVIRAGIEDAFDTELKGIPGISVEKHLDSKKGSQVVLKEPIKGKDIITHINIKYQEIVHSALNDQLEKFNAEWGCAVLMETNTGGIKAIANLALDTINFEYKEKRNYAIWKPIVLGSIFKAVSSIVLLEDGYVDIDDIIDTGNGVHYFFGVPMYDTHKGGYGKISFKKVFEKSSNIGIAKSVEKYYKNDKTRFTDRIHDLHLSEPLGTKILGEGKPDIKDVDDDSWSGITLPWMSIGYEVPLTPLHMLTLYNAIANNGIMVRPQLVKKISFQGKIIKDFTKPDIIDSRICSKETIKKLKLMLEGVVERGTAKKIRTNKYKIAGKTGTAQKADNNKGYGKGKYIATFAGYFPADKPQYACIVVIVEPDEKKGYYGTTVAAPVFRKIADKIYAIDKNLTKKREIFAQQKEGSFNQLVGKKDNLEKAFQKLGYKIENNINSEWVYTKQKGNKIWLTEKNVYAKKIPNVIGMGLKDAVYILEKNNLKVSIKKTGKKVNKTLIIDKNHVALEMI